MITSLQNEIIKNVIKLQNKKCRDNTGLFIVEGMHLINESKKLNLLEEVYTIDENIYNDLNKDNIRAFLVSEPVMKKISLTNSPSNVLGICKKIKNNKLLNKVLMLEDISDPTNLGTLLRSAKSFGFDTVITTPNSVDYYNDKVIRGSQGAIFKLNLIVSDFKDVIKNLKEKGYLVYGTNVRNGISVEDVKKSDKLALILGNESRGMSEEISNLCDKNIYIPLDNMESLNVSVCGSILMYEIKKKMN